MSSFENLFIFSIKKKTQKQYFNIFSAYISILKVSNSSTQKRFWRLLRNCTVLQIWWQRRHSMEPIWFCQGKKTCKCNFEKSLLEKKLKQKIRLHCIDINAELYVCRTRTARWGISSLTQTWPSGRCGTRSWRSGRIEWDSSQGKAGLFIFYILIYPPSAPPPDTFQKNVNDGLKVAIFPYF